MVIYTVYLVSLALQKRDKINISPNLGKMGLLKVYE